MYLKRAHGASRGAEDAICRISGRFLSAGLALCTGVMAVCAASAGFDRPAYGAPPEMPPVFDQATVQTLVQDIDQGQNAVKLKIGYFARRSRLGYPRSEGLALLERCADQAQPDSRRWFVLQSVIGFAGLRVDQPSRETAYAAYSAIFRDSAKAEAAGATDVVERAMYELVATIPGNYGPRWQLCDLTVYPTLLKALAAQLSILKAGGKIPYRIPWARAFVFTGEARAARPVVERALADPQMPASYDFYMLAAEVLCTTDGDRAGELLQKAMPLANGPQERDQVTRTMVERLEAEKKLGEAIALQQKWIGTTGAGRADLLRLLWEAKDRAGIERELTALHRPDANEAEINGSVGAVFTLTAADSDPRSGKLRESAAGLLEGYLSERRVRDVEQELRARLTLSAFDAAGRRPTEAQSVLAGGLKLVPQTHDAMRLYGALVRQYHNLQR